MNSGRRDDSVSTRSHSPSPAMPSISRVVSAATFSRMPVEIARREIGHVLLAELQVPGRIHVDHGVDGGAEQQRMPRFGRAIGHQDAALLRREGFGIAVDAHHVVILGQRPEAGAVIALALPRHRRFGAQLRVDVERLPLQEQFDIGQRVRLDLGIGSGEHGSGGQAQGEVFAQEAHRLVSPVRSPTLQGRVRAVLRHQATPPR